MQYTLYYEEQRKLDMEEYRQIKHILRRREPSCGGASFTLRKLRFCGEDVNDAIPRYSLCVKDQDANQIYLEKKYLQNHIWHKACAKMCGEDCERLLRGDIQWMKGHGEVLFEDFYFQATLNHLSPGKVIEYQREVYRCRDGCVIFNRNVQCVLGGCGDLLKPTSMAIHCLDENKVMMSYRKRADLPNMLREILQVREPQAQEAAFAF